MEAECARCGGSGTITVVDWVEVDGEVREVPRIFPCPDHD